MAQSQRGGTPRDTHVTPSLALSDAPHHKQVVHKLYVLEEHTHSARTAPLPCIACSLPLMDLATAFVAGYAGYVCNVAGGCCPMSHMGIVRGLGRAMWGNCGVICWWRAS